jgi:hypothetical protein
LRSEQKSENQPQGRPHRRMRLCHRHHHHFRTTIRPPKRIGKPRHFLRPNTPHAHGFSYNKSHVRPKPSADAAPAASGVLRGTFWRPNTLAIEVAVTSDKLRAWLIAVANRSIADNENEPPGSATAHNGYRPHK